MVKNMRWAAKVSLITENIGFYVACMISTGRCSDLTEAILSSSVSLDL